MIGVPPDAVLIIDRADAQVLAACVAAQIAEQRRNGLQPAGLIALQSRLEEAAASDRASDPLPILDPVEESRAPLGANGDLPVRTVAKRLGIGPRGVVDLVHRGRLEGRQDGANSRWWVSEQSVTRYEAERDERGGRTA